MVSKKEAERKQKGSNSEQKGSIKACQGKTQGLEWAKPLHGIGSGGDNAKEIGNGQRN